MANKKVVEKTAYADLLNPIIANSNYYVFKEVMGKVNMAGTNYRYNGERSIVIKKLMAGKDVASNLQTYTANAEQQWSNDEEVLTIEHSRKYRDFIADEYVVTGSPLNTAVNIMADFERTGRPETINSQYSENFYNIASKNDTIIEANVTTPEEALALFNSMNETRTENSTGRAIFYCTSKIKSLLKDYIAPMRRWSNDNKISFEVDAIDDVEIKVVPARFLKSKYTKTYGYVPAGDAVQMNAVLVTVDTILTPFLLDNIYIDEPTALSDGKAFILSQFAFDLFVHPEAKTYGVIVAVDETV